MVERDQRDLKGRSDVGATPADNMERFASGGQAIGVLMTRVFFFSPGRQSVALIDGGLQPLVEAAESGTEVRLHCGYTVKSDECLCGIMKKLT
ncbi:MAG TPA: hypothetical protein VME69_07705 [Methylocella sp.]|nr:hypothetical protein [Methylocella sp.]